MEPRLSRADVKVVLSGQKRAGENGRWHAMGWIGDETRGRRGPDGRTAVVGILM